MTKAQAEAARNADLIDYFLSKGYEVKWVGIGNKDLHIKGYGGLYIREDGHAWNSFSGGIGGTNSVDCLVKVLGFSFSDAVAELCGYGDATAPITASAKVQHEKVLRIYGDHVYSCVDNDEAGHSFNIKLNLPACNQILIENNVKDFNELLLLRRSKESESEERTMC